MFEKLHLRFPAVLLFRNYSFRFVRHDTVAGITVAAIALPQALAYAQLAGLPITVGIYAAMVSMFVYALLTSSRFVIMGPDAALAALAGAAVLPLASGDSQKAISLVAVLAIVMGVIGLIGVFTRVSFLADFMSRPILLGYMAGLATIVVITQIPSMVGISIPSGGNAVVVVREIFATIQTVHIPTVIISVTSFLFAVVCMTMFKRFPAGIIILIGSIGASWIFGFKDDGIAVVGTLSMYMPFTNWTPITYTDVQGLFVPAVAMLVIAYANTIANARRFAAKKHERVESDQELFGLSVANAASGVIGGMPVSASSVRSAVNYQTKAKTQMSQIIGVLALGALVFIFAPVMSQLPVAVLGVVIVLAMRPLFDVKELISIWHAWRSEAILAVVTMVGVVVLGIYQGLLLAVILAVLNILRKSAFPNDAVLGIAADGTVRDMSRPPKTQEIMGLKIYRFDAPLYFGNANYFRYKILKIVDESPVPIHWVLWDAETITALDSTSGQMLYDLIHELKMRGITFAVSRMKGSVRDIVHHTHHLNRILYKTPHFSTLSDAVKIYCHTYSVALPEVGKKTM